MAIAFFVSDIGDTDLAWETILKLCSEDKAEEIFIYPITVVAASRIRAKNLPLQVRINEIVTEADIENLAGNKDIKQAYIGVPSASEELPFKIALALNIPCVFAYEFMFKPKEHSLFKYLPLFKEQSKKNISFTVALNAAAEEIQPYVDDVNSIGHLSIDRAFTPVSVDKATVKSKLQITEKEELVFVSATTQPQETDMNFLDAILSELATGKHPLIQVRFGIHPGIKDIPAYFIALTAVLIRYPDAHHKFKIILPAAIKEKLKEKTNDAIQKFILECEVSGTEAANTAERVAQAVLGALPAEAALRGKAAYAHQGESYLPKGLLSPGLADFFSRASQSAPTRSTLGIPNEDAPSTLAKKLRGK